MQIAWHFALSFVYLLKMVWRWENHSTNSVTIPLLHPLETLFGGNPEAMLTENCAMVGHQCAKNESKNLCGISLSLSMSKPRVYICTYIDIRYVLVGWILFFSKFQLYYYHCLLLYHTSFRNILPYFIYKKYFSQIFILRWA